MNYIQKLIIVILCQCIACSISFAQFSATERISQTEDGTQGNAHSLLSMVAPSNDAEYVVFNSFADNLATGDRLGFSDIFLKNRTTGEIEKISVGTTEANGGSTSASVNSTGQFVLFTSDASNLVAGDTNGTSDIFLRDRLAETTTRVSLRDGGTTQINGASFSGHMSDNGQYVVFVSSAAGIVDGVPASGVDHVYLRDTVLNSTELLSRNSDDIAANRSSARPKITPDGRYVVFESEANLVTSFNDNAKRNVYIRDLTNDTIERVSVGRLGGVTDDSSFSADLSDDGRYVVFTSEATNIVANDNNGVGDVFLWDRNSLLSSKTIRISQRGGNESDAISTDSVISGNGEFIVFYSEASTLEPDGTGEFGEIFAYSIAEGTLQKVSRRPVGQDLDSESLVPSINTNGQFVSFTTNSQDILPPKENDVFDVYLVDLQCLLNPATGTPGDTDSDTIDDCSDACPLDPAKSAAGICGCGEVDTDTDSDGAADCVDECPVNADKIVAGACGCEEDDSDTNGSGAPDCLDPKNDSTLREIIVERRRRGRARVFIPTQFPNARYQVILRERRKVIRRFRTRGRVLIRRLTAGRRYSVSYRAFIPEGGFTRESARKSFRARR